jgi:hypothetical protein
LSSLFYIPNAAVRGRRTLRLIDSLYSLVMWHWYIVRSTRLSFYLIYAIRLAYLWTIELRKHLAEKSKKGTKVIPVPALAAV